VLCAQLPRDLFAIAKFLFSIEPGRVGSGHRVNYYRVGSRINLYDPVPALATPF